MPEVKDKMHELEKDIPGTCHYTALQAQYFSKLPFGDHVIQKTRQL